MIIVYVGILGLIIGFIMLAYAESDALIGVLGGIAGGLIGVLIGLVVWLFGCMFITCAPEPGDKVITESYDLIAVRDDYGIEGSFYLGRGLIDSELQYVYAIDGPEGIEVITDNSENIFLKEIEDGETCRMESWYKPIKLNPVVEHLWGEFHAESGKTFYVPKATVEEIYSVDLQ